MNKKSGCYFNGCLDLNYPQEINSKKTSIRQVSRCFTNYPFPEGSIICDFGGGAYDENINYMIGKKCILLVVDPFNRSREYNMKNLEYLCKYPADYVTCNNVLNVIQEEDAMLNCIRNVACLSQNGVALFTVYAGNKNGRGAKTSCGYQQNKNLQYYVDFIKNSGFFNHVEVRNQIIICR